MAFEVFNKRLAPTTKSPSVTIQRRGVISFNRAAYNLMGVPASVELLYDREGGVIGVRPVGEDVPHGYAVRPQSSNKESGPVVIAGTAFTQYYNIDTSVTRRWEPTLVDGILCIDLSQEGVAVLGNRSKSSNSAIHHDSEGM